MRELYEFIEQLYIEAQQADDRQNGRRGLMLGYTKGTADATRGIAKRLERVAAHLRKADKNG